MVWKILLVGSAALFVMKLFFRARLREWGAHLDRAVNLTLILLVVSYGFYFLWRALE